MPHFLDIIAEHPGFQETRQARCFSLVNGRTSSLYGVPCVRVLEFADQLQLVVFFRPTLADTPWEDLPEWAKVSAESVNGVLTGLWSEVSTVDELNGKLDEVVNVLGNVEMLEILAGLTMDAR